MEQNNKTSSLSLEKNRSLSTSSSEEEVRIVGINELEQATQCLAEAFATDDVARYFLDTDDMGNYSEEIKWKLHCYIIRCMTAAHIYKGVVTTIGKNYDAVALWMPPGGDMDDWITFFRAGIWKLHWKLSSEGKKRFFKEFLPILSSTMHNVMKKRGEAIDDCYYLVYLGTKPGSRGKGYGRKLIEHMTVLADREMKCTYLESSAAANLSFYTKLGFVEEADIVLNRGPTPVVLGVMVRPPKPTAEASSKKGEQKAGQKLKITMKIH